MDRPVWGSARAPKIPMVTGGKGGAGPSCGSGKRRPWRWRPKPLVACEGRFGKLLPRFWVGGGWVMSCHAVLGWR